MFNINTKIDNLNVNIDTKNSNSTINGDIDNRTVNRGNSVQTQVVIR